MIIRRRMLALTLVTLGISGALTTASRSQSGQVPVVATFSVLADLVREVGSGRVSVTSLVGPNADAHVYQPTPSDAQRVAEARIIFVNGLGFEGWMTRLIKASGAKAAVVVASRGVKPIEAEAEDHGHSGGGAHPADPHAWQNVANVKLYVAAIRDGLIQADPGSKETYQANASRYLAALDQLESEVRAAINRIPPNRRRIITTHDAFGYFAKAYGLQFIAAQGVSTEAEASAKDVAKIIRQIRAQKVPAVFLENISDPRMMERIAKESGARIGDKVYSDALSEPGGPAGTYIDMMRHNIHAFSAALTS